MTGAQICRVPDRWAELLHGEGDTLVAIDFGAEPVPDETSDVLEDAAAQLQEYFAGERREFDLPLAARGTAFQQRVWAALAEIPYGQTMSYGAGGRGSASCREPPGRSAPRTGPTPSRSSCRATASSVPTAP
ncbi:MAG: MGMT family protein [Nocardioidaceae bacterium]